MFYDLIKENNSGCGSLWLHSRILFYLDLWDLMPTQASTLSKEYSSPSHPSFMFCRLQWLYSQQIQSGPKKCIHSLLINIFGINLNEISISFKFIPKILMSKECIHFLGHSVLKFRRTWAYVYWQKQCIKMTYFCKKHEGIHGWMWTGL